MEVTAVVVVMATVFLWCAVAARLERADLSAPIVFVVVGALLAALSLVSGTAAPELLKPLVEVTLVWVLFSDAARIPLRDLREDWGRCVRLLAVGFPLSALAGWGLAGWLFPGLGVWLALFVGAALAPTDAALGVPVVTNPVVPSRMRRLITVESGLNDGIATPVVTFSLTAAASAEGLRQAPGLGAAVAELVLGVVLGVALGGAGGWFLRWARSRGWAAEDFAGVAVLALALVAYGAALAIHANGFVAAFCGGLAFGAAAGRKQAAPAFLEQASGLASLLVWLAFGAIAVPLILTRIDVRTIGYAVLSLTLVRMVPVALALLGSGMDWRSVLFVGWFGPRGLASLIFALLALEQLGPQADEVVSIVAVTVVLSVITHGLTAAPLAARYGAREADQGPETGSLASDIPVRGLPRRLGRFRAAADHGGNGTTPGDQ